MSEAIQPCRSCGTPLRHTFCDLGITPLSNAFLKAEQLKLSEPFYPLHAYVCEVCFLVQLEEYESPKNIFSYYVYFSSYSQTWLEHARQYTEMMVGRFGFDSSSLVIEVASNDGYLLKFFKEKGISVLGIDPAKNVAQVAQADGIPTLIDFFGKKIASELANQNKQADLLLGNNVLAHVPDLHDFIEGLKILLKPEGILTLEFPHLLRLMEQGQFDTIYHEHFSYFSLIAVEKIFEKHGLRLFDIEELPTHGGSLRIFVTHANAHHGEESKNLDSIRNLERQEGLDSLQVYINFSQKTQEKKKDILDALKKLKRSGNSLAVYGAAAKGNTLLNYCGIGTDIIDYAVDRNPGKQGCFLPGTHIPVFHPDKIKETQPDYLLILPWNIKEEIMDQMDFIRNWGGQFVIPIPNLEILP